MPEIKNNFTGGKMNKDLDERLIPNGQYRHAENIQVSTSDGSDIGTIQNILGNLKKNTYPTPGVTSGFTMPTSAKCVGSVSDEKNDTLYWFIKSDTQDLIIRYVNGVGMELVFVDNKVGTNEAVLKFQQDNLITGINIIDDMLFWTDNINEPRKINITRCIEGTSQNALVQTKLVNPYQGITASSAVQNVIESQITVVKTSPRSPLVLKLDTSRDPTKQYTGIITTTTDPGFDPNESSFTADYDHLHDFSTLEIGDTFQIMIETDIDGSDDYTLEWNFPNTNSPIGTKLVIKEFDDNGNPPNIPITDYRIRGVITAWDDGFAGDYNSITEDTNTGGYVVNTTGGQNFPSSSLGRAHVQIEITAIEGNPPVVSGIGNTLDWAIDLFDETEKLFEFKFPRFSYRYRYLDGEYSCFAPWSEVAFVPGSFDHHPKKGYNLGMTNRLTKVNLSNYIPEDIPKDVKEVEILYKEDVSPNVYILKTIKQNAPVVSGGNNYWNINSIDITTESIESVVASNQLLRPWDNVPRKALAQDVTGNRIVYANYWQNYDLISEHTNTYGVPTDYEPTHFPQIYYSIHLSSLTLINQ